MSTTTCSHCPATVSGGITLCKRCQTTLATAITNIAHYHADLPSLGEHRVRIRRADGHADPVLDHVAATITRTYDDQRDDALTSTLHTLRDWSDRLVSSTPRLYQPANNVPAIAKLLAQQTTTIATKAWGGEMTTAILRLERQLLSLVQRGKGSWYAGVCSADLETGGLCDRDLYAAPGTYRIRCRDCGTWWNVNERRTFLIEEARDALLPISIIARAAVQLLDGEPSVDRLAKRISKWAERNQLDDYGVRVGEAWGNRARRVYRLGDVLDTLIGEASRVAG